MRSHPDGLPQFKLADNSKQQLWVDVYFQYHDQNPNNNVEMGFYGVKAFVGEVIEQGMNHSQGQYGIVIQSQSMNKLKQQFSGKYKRCMTAEQ